MAQVDTSLFRPELVFFDFEATDEWDFFKQMQRKLQDMGYVKEGWYDAITQREKSFPTGLQFEKIGIAIPHVDPENIVKPYIAVIKPKTTIDFAPMADMVDHPVHTELIINLGLLAHAEDQVAVLQAMMGIFMDEEATADIMSRDSAEGIIEAITKRC
ncbi:MULTISPECIES: PTS sugar transporter subunit IIA [Atopobiaceae]|uniref:PTS system IIA component, Gat family n=1 Tax=Parafannyhessea umbonata TaxID=604330 RepID=A0A1H9N1W7_9ACTN|nr:MULTISPECIES: PTS sugar transporter subunit IIA [Atopobiaceae]SEH36586.1 PTS system IIA component, Gat family [Parafannyhessea umbonata]SER29343.1 PTS system IIA component, Gat family [Parafannyhessea umbonata]SJZ38333.1 PTS system IIA component, Gat family (TC 4.A.5) [Olsenella sp. KH1P3]